MSQNLKSRLQEDMKSAMRAKATLQLSTIRMLMAAVKKTVIDQKVAESDELILQIINTMIKQRRDSKEQFLKADRAELAEKEGLEIDILQTYLPEPMDQTSIEKAIEKALNETQASGPKDMGKVMALLKKELQGRADMGMVSQLVKDKLNP